MQFNQGFDAEAVKANQRLLSAVLAITVYRDHHFWSGKYRPRPKNNLPTNRSVRFLVKGFDNKEGTEIARTASSVKCTLDPRRNTAPIETCTMWNCKTPSLK